jgi:MtN3 and saliva related transmembrane protein
MNNIFWFSIGLMAAILTMFGFVPQIIKILKTKHVKDISFFMLVQTCIGASLWILYGIHIHDSIVIVANVVSLITLIIVIFLYFNYRSPEGYFLNHK